MNQGSFFFFSLSFSCKHERKKLSLSLIFPNVYSFSICQPACFCRACGCLSLQPFPTITRRSVLRTGDRLRMPTSQEEQQQGVGFSDAELAEFFDFNQAATDPPADASVIGLAGSMLDTHQSNRSDIYIHNCFLARPALSISFYCYCYGRTGSVNTISLICRHIQLLRYCTINQFGRHAKVLFNSFTELKSNSK